MRESAPIAFRPHATSSNTTDRLNVPEADENASRSAHAIFTGFSRYSYQWPRGRRPVWSTENVENALGRQASDLLPPLRRTRSVTTRLPQYALRYIESDLGHLRLFRTSAAV